ncbi:hypothetical protein [Sphingomonas sp.]|jgi:hypothetical protein|uniref:hypothetical protein n=1 Tax=Sphingomonas sp. TaxID=28214 RepID=UPI002EDB3588
MTDDREFGRNGGSRTKDIGWKQFSVSIFDLVRWPAAFVIVMAILREPLSTLINSVSAALRS